MIPSRKHAALLLAVMAAGVAAACWSLAQSPDQPAVSPAPQTPYAPPMNHNLIVLDPAHGGSDPGATLGQNLLEKDYTLALAGRLRASLVAAGFNVISTRDADPTGPYTPDQRADAVNHAHALACIVLHATNTGSGVHIYTSTLQPPEPDDTDSEPRGFTPVSWDSAQASYVAQSLRLAGDLKSAAGSANLPAISGAAPVRPLDNLLCPAVAIEVAPLTNSGADSTPVTDADYQQRITKSLTSALQVWRTHADPQLPASTDNPQPAPKPLASPRKPLPIAPATHPPSSSPRPPQ